MLHHRLRGPLVGRSAPQYATTFAWVLHTAHRRQRIDSRMGMGEKERTNNWNRRSCCYFTVGGGSCLQAEIKAKVWGNTNNIAVILPLPPLLGDWGAIGEGDRLLG